MQERTMMMTMAARRHKQMLMDSTRNGTRSPISWRVKAVKEQIPTPKHIRVKSSKKETPEMKIDWKNNKKGTPPFQRG